MGQAAIDDYGVVGDCRSAALISRGGSVDWLCWPRFDSPSLFGALLDPEAGHFRITPLLAANGSSGRGDGLDRSVGIGGDGGRLRTRRRYLPDTNVLETVFETDGGSLRLVDLMPVASEAEKKRTLFPDHELLRVATCTEGEVEVEVSFCPRPGYGRGMPELRDDGPHFGIRGRCGRAVFILRSNVRLQLRGADAIARFALRAGEQAVFSLTYAQESPTILPPLSACDESIARTCAWWRGWLAQMRYDGPYREAVARSALALRLLVYAPSGAIVAAPTTSLPEEIGGSKNWDYRYCWLRDASLVLRALLGLGFTREAESFMSWLLHTTRLTRPRLRVLYDVYGESSGREVVLPLRGYRDSRPVRVGNAAERQLQLDVYGEVIDAATQWARVAGRLDRETSKMLVGFGKTICNNWRRYDEGIWEVRSGPAPHTHSRVMCWAGLDRLISLSQKGYLSARAPLDRFERERENIRRDVLEHGWDERQRSYVNVYDEDTLDAVLLLLPWYGFEAPSSRRMRATYRRVVEKLSAGPGLLYRYLSFRGADEGAFGICAFWAVDFLASGGGSLDEARERFEQLLGYANELGLYAEEIDPATGAALGNFPQGFTHLGLINAALAIEDRKRGERRPHHRLPDEPVMRGELRGGETFASLSPYASREALVELDARSRQDGEEP